MENVLALLGWFLLHNKVRMINIVKIRGKLYILKIEELKSSDDLIATAIKYGILSKEELTENARQIKREYP